MEFWNTAGAFALFISSGAVGVGMILLAGYRMKLKHRLEEARLKSASLEGLDEFRQEVHELLAQQQAQLDEVHERLDFAERLLTQGRGKEGPEPT